MLVENKGADVCGSGSQSQRIPVRIEVLELASLCEGDVGIIVVASGSSRVLKGKLVWSEEEGGINGKRMRCQGTASQSQLCLLR